MNIGTIDELIKKVEKGVIGTVQWESDGKPLSGVQVKLFSLIADEPKALVSTKTDSQGQFTLRLDDKTGRSLHGCEFYLAVVDRKERVLISTQDTPIHLNQQVIQTNILVPGSPDIYDDECDAPRPTIRVGGLDLNAKTVAEVKPETVLNIARALINPAVADREYKQIAALSRDLLPDGRLQESRCGTPILETIEALVKLKKWPREILLQVDYILAMREFGFAEETYECPNFIITYQTSGPAAVNPDTSAQSVDEPGSNPPVSIGTLAAGSPPTYVKRVCFWLERALASYISAPFSMRNPAASGKIPVVINSAAFGSASTSGTFYLNNNLGNDLLCAVAVHELFHMVQFKYAGSGNWLYSIREGGAVFAEDSAADLMNRYLDEAGTNFNGTGVQNNPNLSLETAGYKCSLFWRYIAEQHSPDRAEPYVGVETYRRIIEQCSSGSYSTADVRAALRDLPWYQDFYEFQYLDPANLDRTSSETTFGNYALACYLKDLGVDVPDTRFDFIEDEENIYIDEVIPGAPLQSTLASVMLSGTGAITPTSGASFSASVNSFGSRYYVVTVDPAVTNVNIQFTSGSGLTGRLFQIALIDEDNRVRDIHRSDFSSYTKRVTNLRDGKRLNRILLLVSGTTTGGSFTVQASAAAPAPDVMVTRWHSVMKQEYEIDSRNWAWTWISPDIWVDNNGDGMADGSVFFNYDNHLFIRLHNKGNLDASGIQVQFFYQDAAGGLSNTHWLSVQNEAGVTQTLTGLSLAAGTSNMWSMNWSPVPTGGSNHFCIRAIVTVPGDPNTDNKRVLSNFGHVVANLLKIVEVPILRRNIFDRLGPVTLRVIPRLQPEIEIANRDLVEQETVLLNPGEVVQDVLHLTRVNFGGRIIHEHYGEDEENHNGCPPAKRLETRPDPRGFYRTDPRALPPGVAKANLMTIVHEVDGLAIGGVTYMVTSDENGEKQPPEKQ